MPFQMDWKKVIKVIFSPWEVQLTQSARRDKHLFAVLARLIFCPACEFLRATLADGSTARS